MRSVVQPLIVLIEPISEWLLLGIIISWVVTVLFGWSPVAFFFVHTLVWFVLDYILLRIVQVSRVRLDRGMVRLHGQICLSTLSRQSTIIIITFKIFNLLMKLLYHSSSVDNKCNNLTCASQLQSRMSVRSM